MSGSPLHNAHQPLYRDASASALASGELSAEDAARVEAQPGDGSSGGGDSPPPDPPPPDAPTKRRRGRFAILFGGTAVLIASLISMILHFGLVAFLEYGVLPPVRSDFEYALSPRLVALFEVPEEEEPEVAAAPEPPAEEVPEPVALSRAEPEPEPEPEVSTVIDEPPPQPELIEAPAGGGAAFDMVGMGGAGGGGGGVHLPSGSGTGTGTGRGTGSGSGERVAVKPAEPAPERRRSRPTAIQLEDTSVAPKPKTQTPSLGYPRELRERGIEGRVVVQCIITERGAVRACRHRSGPDELGEYAMSIIRQWTFEPGQDHAGRAVPVAYTFRFPFRLR